MNKGPGMKVEGSEETSLADGGIPAEWACGVPSGAFWVAVRDFSAELFICVLRDIKSLLVVLDRVPIAARKTRRAQLAQPDIALCSHRLQRGVRVGTRSHRDVVSWRQVRHQRVPVHRVQTEMHVSIHQHSAALDQHQLIESCSQRNRAVQSKDGQGNEGHPPSTRLQSHREFGGREKKGD